jgi:hypothetical protein
MAADLFNQTRWTVGDSGKAMNPLYYFGNSGGRGRPKRRLMDRGFFAAITGFADILQPDTSTKFGETRAFQKGGLDPCRLSSGDQR